VPKHIVIIEHDQDVLETMQRLLEAEAYIVTTFTRFPSMAELAFMRADCFVIDEWLPQVSGHAICLMLKAKIQTNRTPVVLVSTTHLFEPMANLCEADAVVGKPFSGGELVRVVSSLLFRNKISIARQGNS
jgi:DNA-binding response OmpR family regulator